MTLTVTARDWERTENDLGNGDWSVWWGDRCNKAGFNIDCIRSRVNRVRVYFFRDGQFTHYAVPVRSPELEALCRHCPRWEPLVDWLIENAETAEQKLLAAELEKVVEESLL